MPIVTSSSSSFSQNHNIKTVSSQNLKVSPDLTNAPVASRFRIGQFGRMCDQKNIFTQLEHSLDLAAH